MRRFLADHPKNKYGEHRYTLEQFRLDPDEEPSGTGGTASDSVSEGYRVPLDKHAFDVREERFAAEQGGR